MNQPIEELAVVLADTNALMVNDARRDALVKSLRDIADKIPLAVIYSEKAVVVSEKDAKEAAEARTLMLADLNSAETLLREFDNKLMERLFKTHRAWTALLGKFTGPLGDASKLIKQKIMAYQQAEQEKAAAEQRRLQAEADERARKERERLEKAASNLKTPELKEQRLEEAAQIAAPVVQVVAPKAAVKMSKRWSVAKVDKVAFMAAAATDKNLHGYVTINENGLARAKAANSELTVPGVVFEQKLV